jgi:hypothetical protein
MFMEDLRKKIEQQAYNLFVKRGGEHGHELEDWIQAEKEIVLKSGSSKIKPLPEKPIEILETVLAARNPTMNPAHKNKQRQPQKVILSK